MSLWSSAPGGIEMALAKHGRIVARPLQLLHHGGPGRIKIFHHVPVDAVLMRIQARHNGRPRGLADWALTVGVCKPDTLIGHVVQMRGLNRAVSGAPKRVMAVLVTKKKNDVGPNPGHNISSKKSTLEETVS